MRNLLLTTLTIFVIATNSFSQTNTVGLTWEPGANSNINQIGTYLYYSTNDVGTTINKSRIFHSPLIYTNDAVPVSTNLLNSMYVTSVDTNTFLESDVSNQIRYQMFPYYRGLTNKPLTLLSYTNVAWTNFVLIRAPTNGILSGTPPNLVYTPTNTSTFYNKDSFVYKSPELFGGTNIVYYYGVYFYWINSAPVLRELRIK